MKKSLLFVFLSVVINAQEKNNLNFIDLNTTANSYPKSFITTPNNETYLHAEDGYQGRHLWRINKTTNKLELVNHNRFNIYENISESTKLFEINNSIFWFQNTSSGRGLYKLSNGKVELIHKLNSEIKELYKKDNKVYFTTGDFSYSIPYQLWETDGNTVSEINLPIKISDNIHVDNSTNNFIYFTFNSSNNTSFWAYNLSTKKFTQLSSQQSTNWNRGNILFNDKIYISDYSTQTGYELYQINGTTKTLVKDIIQGSESGILDQLIGASTNNEFFFIGLDRYYRANIYRSNGSSSGTSLFYNLSNEYSDSYNYEYKFVSIDNGIAFTAKNYNKTDLWKIVNGKISKIISVQDKEIQLFQDNFVAVGNQLYKINTTSFTPVLPQHNFNEINNFYFDSNSVYFAGSTTEKGSEPYRLNKNTLQLEPLDEINYLGSSYVSDFMKSAQKLYFQSGHSKFLYQNNSFQKLNSDKDIYPTFNHFTDKFSNYISTDKGLIFKSNYNLHLIDINNEIKSTLPEPISISSDSPLNKINNTVFFLGVDEYYDKYVYKTDGTINSTIKVSDVAVEFDHEYSQGVINNHLYYIVKEDYNIAKMYKTDGKTNQLIFTFPSHFITPRIIGIFQNQLILNIYNTQNYRYEVYLFDGKSLGKIIQDFTTNYSEVNALYIDDDHFVGAIAGKLVAYDGITKTTKYINASTNEFQSIKNLTKCGETYYATRYQSDFVFFTDFNSSIQNHQLGYTLTPKIECYKGNAIIMRHIDNYSNYGKNDIIVDVINGKDHKQIYFIPNDNSVKNIEWKQKDFTIFDDKIFIGVENPKYGQELMFGDLNVLSLNTIDVHESKNSNSTFKIYPNPVSNHFSVQSSEKIEKITLYNLQGQIVYSIQNNILNNPKFILDQRIPDGIYFVKIESKSKSETKKLIIKR